MTLIKKMSKKYKKKKSLIYFFLTKTSKKICKNEQKTVKIEHNFTWLYFSKINN